jgi:hypothetical protein
VPLANRKFIVGSLDLPIFEVKFFFTLAGSDLCLTKENERVPENGACSSACMHLQKEKDVDYVTCIANASSELIGNVFEICLMLVMCKASLSSVSVYM